MFFVEARYHRNPQRAADQVRYIAHREVGLPDGQHRQLYGIGARYRAFRGNEQAIQRALRADGSGLRNPVYFSFILTVDNATADRFAKLDATRSERVLRDAVGATFRGAARGTQGVFAVHQHGGEGRSAHPHVHALFSPRLESGAPIHISPQRLQRIKERWEQEVLRVLARQERRTERDPEPLERPKQARPRGWPITGGPIPAAPAQQRTAVTRRPGPFAHAFAVGRLPRRLLRGNGSRWRAIERSLAFGRQPERKARRATLLLLTRALPSPFRIAIALARDVHRLGQRLR